LKISSDAADPFQEQERFGGDPRDAAAHRDRVSANSHSGLPTSGQYTAKRNPSRFRFPSFFRASRFRLENPFLPVRVTQRPVAVVKQPL